MKKISYWAIMNPWTSQTILVCCHLLLAVLAIYAGVLLFSHDIIIPKTFFYVGEILFFILFISYPIRRARYKFWKMNYAKQKWMDGGLVLSYLLMAVTITNTDSKLAYNEDAKMPFVTTIAMKENPQQAENTSKPFVLSKKAVKKQFKSWVTSMKDTAASDENFGGKIGLTILLMIILMFAIAFLACTIGCSGSNTLALAVFSAGWTLILILGIQYIRKVKGKKKSTYEPMPEVE